MNVTRLTRLLAIIAIAATAANAHAAFIVEPLAAGKAFANFSSTDGSPTASTTPSAALGLTSGGSIFGGSGAIDEWVFTYTPGTDADNTVFAPGTVLGETRVDPPSTASAEQQLASGLVGGVSGLYKVFITWPPSSNVNAAGSTITITNDGSPIVLNPVGQNDSGANVTDAGIGGASQWLLIGTASLTAGNTYSVTQLANAPTFVGQRNAGVMWELQVPEPASAGIAGMAGLALLSVRRRVA